MKITAIIFAIMFFVTVDSFATDQQNDRPWDFFGVVFVPGVPSSSNDANIGGIRIGLPVAGGSNEIRGVEVGLACCWTKDVYGLQTAPFFCISDTLYGFQASPVNIADKVVGMQFGLVNISKDAKFQLGLLNYIEGAVIPYMIIINWKF